MLRKLGVVIFVSLALAGWAAAAGLHAGATVRIMTQNMDDGTDLTYIIAAIQGKIPGLSVGSAVDLTFQELRASNFEGRARLLAKQIAEGKPDFLALQEAVLWRFGSAPKPDDVLYDPLELLLSALRALRVPYDVVTVNSLSDVAVPGVQIGGYLRFTDRNVLLVRSDLRPAKLQFSDVQSLKFAATFPFAGFTIYAGWISAEVQMGDERFRLVTTHLQTPIQDVPEATLVQLAQAQELIDALQGTTIPVVICGDFNSDATHSHFVDDTPTVDLIEMAGYTEAWPMTHHRRDPGLTWPLYLEDQFPDGGFPPPFFAESEPIERIDLFFSKDMDVVRSDRVLAPAPGPLKRHSFETPPYGSDHAGVIAVFRLLP